MKTALVLAGGGAKGAYQAGSIKALRELGYSFDIVTGTSIGALNGLLIAQEDYEKLYTLWLNITPQDVMKYPIDFTFTIDSLLRQKNLIPSFFKSYIDNKGADISPLITLIHAQYDSEKFKKSTIDYGLVTVTYPELIPQEITKKDMNIKNAVEYAIASASCFPAFPVHKVQGQGYIDGGYYDNLPISLALDLGAKQIITIELQTKPLHAYFLNRPNIIRIRPSRSLGAFMDFSREAINERITLGYLDTYKKFKKYKGYAFTFMQQPLPMQQQLYFYDTILSIENALNHPSPKIILDTIKPLTNYLLENTQQEYLSLEEYLILGLENVLHIFKYPYDTIYDYAYISTTILEDFKKGYQAYSFSKNTRTISPKKLTTLLKNITPKEAIYYIYHILESKGKMNNIHLAKVYPRPYLAALYFYTLTKKTPNIGL